MTDENVQRFAHFTADEREALITALTALAEVLVSERVDAKLGPKEVARRSLVVGDMVSQISVFEGGPPVNAEIRARMQALADA